MRAYLFAQVFYEPIFLVHLLGEIRIEHALAFHHRRKRRLHERDQVRRGEEGALARRLQRFCSTSDGYAPQTGLWAGMVTVVGDGRETRALPAICGWRRSSPTTPLERELYRSVRCNIIEDLSSAPTGPVEKLPRRIKGKQNRQAF